MEDAMATNPITEEEVSAALDRFQNSYEQGDDKFFEHFDEKASLFTLSSPTRIDGREVYRRGFQPYFSGQKRRSQVLSPEIRILGDDSALVTFHNRILANGVSTNIRATLIFQRDAKGSFQIVHTHLSPLGQGVSAAPTKIEDVTLLEERVASAAAMAGTPK
jgi:ketosteroid isomerase-like protein